MSLCQARDPTLSDYVLSWRVALGPDLGFAWGLDKTSGGGWSSSSLPPSSESSSESSETEMSPIWRRRLIRALNRLAAVSRTPPPLPPPSRVDDPDDDELLLLDIRCGNFHNFNFQVSYSTEVINGAKNIKHQHLLLDEDEEEEEEEFPDASDLVSLSLSSSFLSLLASSLSSLSVSAEAAAGTFLRALAPSDSGQAWTIIMNLNSMFLGAKHLLTILLRRTIT